MRGVEFGRVRTAGIVLLVVAVAGVFGLTQFRKKSERRNWLDQKDT